MEIITNKFTVNAAKALAKVDGKKSVAEWALAIHYALDRAESITANDGEMPRGWNTAWCKAYAEAVSGAVRLDQFGSKAWAIVSAFAGGVFDDEFARTDVQAMAVIMADTYGGLSSAYGKLPKDEEAPKGPKAEKSVLELLVVAARRAKDQGLSAEDFLALAAEAFGG